MAKKKVKKQAKQRTDKKDRITIKGSFIDVITASVSGKRSSPEGHRLVDDDTMRCTTRIDRSHLRSN